MNMIQIKEGQIYRDSDDNRFLIKDITFTNSNDSIVYLQSLDETEQYFINEVIPIKEKWFYERNLKLDEEIQYTEELKYECEIKELMSDILRHKREIGTLNDKIKTKQDKIKKYLEELHKINPNNNPILDYIKGV